MKKLYWTALLALPLLATPTYADGFCLPGFCSGAPGLNFKFTFGCGGCSSKPSGCGGYQLGPWYNYWPLEAHFVNPAPTGYPYWPQPQALYNGPIAVTAPAPAYATPSPTPAPLVASAPAQPVTQSKAEVKPVGYNYYPYLAYPTNVLYGPAPSYWTPRP